MVGLYYSASILAGRAFDPFVVPPCTSCKLVLVIYHQISIPANFDFQIGHNLGNGQNPVNHVNNFKTLSSTYLNVADREASHPT